MIRPTRQPRPLLAPVRRSWREDIDRATVIEALFLLALGAVMFGMVRWTG